jgi:hypothetical protein
LLAFSLYFNKYRGYNKQRRYEYARNEIKIVWR